MAEWKDVTSYSQGEKDTPKVWHARFGEIRLSVHQYVGCGDTWFTSCQLWSKLELESKYADDAMEEAVSMLRTALQEAICDVESIQPKEK